MKTLISFFLTVVVVAAISSFATERWMSSRQIEIRNAHEWLHEQLKLTPAQKSALAPIEKNYDAQRQQLLTKLHKANRELARDLANEKAFSPTITAAIEKIHQVQGDLQKATIEHFFQMKTVLTPPQAAKLMHLAEQALEAKP